MIGNSLHLRKSNLVLGVLFSSLLLISVLSTIVQVSATQPDPWAAADNVVDEATAFFDDSYIHEIRLWFEDPVYDDKGWYDTLYDTHDSDRNTADPYYPARFESHGITIDPIGARFKGLSTFGFGGGGFFFGGGNTEDEAIKKPFKLDFNMYDEEGSEESTFFGLKKLCLNNGALDPSLIREKLFMDFASNYVTAPRSVFTHLYVNDEYYGLYLAMEHIGNTFVESRFGGDQDGNIYKAESMCTLEYLGEDPSLYDDGSYELKNNEETNDWSSLIRLTDVLTNTPISNLPEELESILDVKSAIYSLALLDLFNSGDSYIGNARNYYIYERSDTGQFIHQLWDANLAFGGFGFGFGFGDSPDPTEYGIFPPSTVSGFGGGFFGGGGASTNTLVLVDRVLAVEAYNRTYLRALAQMLREGFDADSIRDRSQELSDLIRDAVYNDTNLSTDASEFDSEIEASIDFVEKRAAFVDTQLNLYAQKTDLQLNDLMTVNQNTIADDLGDYDPWVEIYNLGPGLVTTDSLFLTDDLYIPNKWALPAQNLNDGEFQLLWLDSEPNEGTNHAPFSLNSDGGNLYLYLYDGSDYVLVDNISYPTLDSDVSFGRFPDGEGVWHTLSEVVTPAMPNIYNEVPESVFINEFMANNDAAVAGPYEDYPDWIELYNGGTEAVDLGGMYLTDDLGNPDAWQFPSNTIIDAGGFLVVWADNLPERGLLHASFSLNASSESIGLFASDGETAIDYIVYTEQLDDVSYARLPDGSSNWTFSTATVGSSNALGTQVTPTSSPTQFEVPESVFINEFMANNDAAVAGPYEDYPDWIELYNGGTEAVDLGGMYLTDDLGNPDAWQFPSNTIIDAGGFLVVWADNLPERGALHTSFGLNASGEAVGLFASDGQTTVDSIMFTEQLDDVSYARLPDGSSNWTYLTATPNASNTLGEIVDPTQPVEVPESVFINEFMANNDAAVAGPYEDYPDWIELYNGGTEAVDLGGMYLTDDLGNPDAWQFPSNTIIDAGGFLVVWADNDPEKGSMHANFGLNASGEAIGLFAGDGNSEVDSVVFGVQQSDISYGRLPDGTSNWTYLTPTPGLQNEADTSNGGPTNPVDEIPEGLVINEFMADNGATIAGPDGTNPDWIELYNGGTEAVDLGGMYLTDDLNDPMAWRFPDNTVIEPGGFVLIWADRASDSDGLHCGFALNANGEAIALFASDAITLIDSITYTKQLQDVSYGRLPDGADTWDHLLSATPGWGNNKRQPYDTESSFTMILLLLGVIGVITVLFVAVTKYGQNRR